MTGAQEPPSAQQARGIAGEGPAKISAAEAERLHECLAGDGVAVIPTDTVYGLACNPLSERAVACLYELKQRPPRKPSAVMFFSKAAAMHALPELPRRTRAAAQALLPGPVTLLLPNPHNRFPLASFDGPLGLRVPLLEGPLAALSAVTAPAMQSSANLSGGADPQTLADVPEPLREGADLALDGGRLSGTASTVIDLTRYEQDAAWRIVREGPLSEADIERLIA